MEFPVWAGVNVVVLTGLVAKEQSGEALIELPDGTGLKGSVEKSQEDEVYTLQGC